MPAMMMRPAPRVPGLDLTLRKFLYTIVALILLAAATLFGLRLYGDDLTQTALVPDVKFAQLAPLAGDAYRDPAMWFSHPAMAAADDPARWQPQVDAERSLPITTPAPETAEPPPPYAVFFVHPTSLLDSTRWNAALDHRESQDRARLMVRGMASAFGQTGQIWAPRYRQATFGAIISDAPAANAAIDAAYGDIASAFATFVASIPAEMPIVLVGHSQGALHVIRLLREEVAGTSLADRTAVAYPIGWPISVEHDLPQLGLAACNAPDAAPCIASWASFAEPAEPGLFLLRYAALPGLDGQPRGASPILCVNPLTGTAGGDAGMDRNLGTLVPNADLSDGALVAGAVPARCDPASGLLLIGDPPELGNYVLPGNNYHVYDIPLFWANVRADVDRRVRAWAATRN